MQRKLSKEPDKKDRSLRKGNWNISRLLKNEEAKGSAKALGSPRENNWHLKIVYPGKLSF